MAHQVSGRGREKLWGVPSPAKSVLNPPYFDNFDEAPGFIRQTHTALHSSGSTGDCRNDHKRLAGSSCSSLFLSKKRLRSLLARPKI